MRRQPVGLPGNPAAAFGIRRRDRWQEREIVGLWEPPATSRDSAERHCCLFSDRHNCLYTSRIKKLFVWVLRSIYRACSPQASERGFSDRRVQSDWSRELCARTSLCANAFAPYTQTVCRVHCSGYELFINKRKMNLFLTLKHMTQLDDENKGKAVFIVSCLKFIAIWN